MPGKKSAGDSDRKKSGADDEAGAQARTGLQSRVLTVVLTACAAMSHRLTIESWNPPRMVPEDALSMTLGELGITELEEFRELLKSLVPEEARAKFDNIEIGSGTRLGELAETWAASL